MIEFSETTAYVFRVAEAIRLAFKSNYLGSEHVLAGLIVSKTFHNFNYTLASVNLSPRRILHIMKDIHRRGMEDSLNVDQNINLNLMARHFTPRTRMLIEKAMENAKLRADSISVFDLVLVILREKDCVASRILKRSGISISNLQAAISEELKERIKAGGKKFKL